MAEGKQDAVAKVPAAEIEKAYAAILEGEPIEFASDAEAMAKQIAERAKEATSLGELLAESTLEAWGDFADVPVTVKAFHLNPSQFEKGPAVYAVVDLVRLDNGEEMLVSVGSQTVLTQLVRAVEMGWLPADLKLKSSPAASGNNAYRLIAV